MFENFQAFQEIAILRNWQAIILLHEEAEKGLELLVNHEG